MTLIACNRMHKRFSVYLSPISDTSALSQHDVYIPRWKFATLAALGARPQRLLGSACSRSGTRQKSAVPTTIAHAMVCYRLTELSRARRNRGRNRLPYTFAITSHRGPNGSNDFSRLRGPIAPVPSTLMPSATMAFATMCWSVSPMRLLRRASLA